MGIVNFADSSVESEFLEFPADSFYIDEKDRRDFTIQVDRTYHLPLGNADLLSESGRELMAVALNSRMMTLKESILKKESELEHLKMELHLIDRMVAENDLKRKSYVKM